MTDRLSYEQLLEQEQQIVQNLEAEIKGLEQELASRRHLIQVLTDMIEGKIPQKNIDPTHPTDAILLEGTLPAYIRQDSLPLLRAIKDRSLSAEAIVAECKKAGLNLDRVKVLFRLGMYRRHYGFVESEVRGLYRLTPKARIYLDSRYPQGVTPNTQAQANAGNEKPRPLDSDETVSAL